MKTRSPEMGAEVSLLLMYEAALLLIVSRGILMHCLFIHMNPYSKVFSSNDHNTLSVLLLTVVSHWNSPQSSGDARLLSLLGTFPLKGI